MAGCLFCKIISKEFKASVVYEDDEVFAFNDINPQAPRHILVIPKKHIDGIAALTEKGILEKLFLAMQKIAKELGIEESGYRIVVNQGPDAGQAVQHLHFHLLGGRPLNWPPG